MHTRVLISFAFNFLGYDNQLVVYTHAGDALEYKGSLDVVAAKATRVSCVMVIVFCVCSDLTWLLICSLGQAVSAMDKFRTLDSKGTSDAAATATAVETTHQNAISAVS